MQKVLVPLSLAGSALLLGCASWYLIDTEAPEQAEIAVDQAPQPKMLQRLRKEAKAKMKATLAADPGAEEGSRSSYYDWFYRQRAAPADSIPEGARRQALAHAVSQNLPAGAENAKRTTAGFSLGGGVSGPGWFFMGPSYIPNAQTDTSVGPPNTVSGRLQDLAVHPSNSEIVYAGGAQGGVWKTTNASAPAPTWTPLTDREASMATGSIAIDPVDPEIVYVGTGEPAGSCDSYFGEGVLRSDDGGATWTQLGQAEFGKQAISKVIVNPTGAGTTDSSTIFTSVRTGFFSGGTSNCQAAPGSITGGVFRSTDSGATWTQLNVPTGAGGTQQVHDMEIDPDNANVIYAAVRGFGDQTVAGIWKTTNALAANPTWTRLGGGYPTTTEPQTRRITTAIGGSGFGGTLYVTIEGLSGAEIGTSAVWGIYKTTDGGTSWSHVDGGANGTGNVAGGGTTLTRLTGPMFAASMVGQRIIFNDQVARTVASVTDGDNLELNTAVTGAITGGEWSVGSYPLFCNGQCFYDMSIGVDPLDDDIVYVAGNPQSFGNDLNATGANHSMWRSDDGGASWRSVSQGSAVTGGLHVDNHAIVFGGAPAEFGAGSVVYSGNDGGLWRSEDMGATWNNLNTNLGITQFQGLSQHPTDPAILMGGTQDNGTNIRDASFTSKEDPPPAWFHSDFGDGGQSVIDTTDPDRRLHTYFNGATFMGPAKATDGGAAGPGNWAFSGGYFGFGAQYYNGFTPGDQVLFYAPLAAHPGTTPNVIYFGSDKLYRSPDPLPAVAMPPNTSWTAVSEDFGVTLSWIEAFPNLIGGDEVLYIGASNGMVAVSSNIDDSVSGCPDSCTSTWNQIQNPAVTPARFVTDIEALSTDGTGNTIYVTFTGFNSATPGTPGHVFKTTNALAPTPTWTNITGNLPDTPVNAIAIDPTTSPATLYVGTDIGVFASLNDGASWIYYNNGHPVVSVFALDRSPTTGQIVSSTHGRGMWELSGQDGGVSVFVDGFESGNTSAWSFVGP